MSYCIDVSPLCFTIIDDQDLPVAIFGCHPQPDGKGLIWLLATPKLAMAKVQFIRNCKPYVEAIQDANPLLYNYVDERNALHIKWLKWLGFTFIKRHHYFGRGCLPFLEFVRIKQHV